MNKLPTIRIQKSLLLEDCFELPPLPEKIVHTFQKAWEQAQRRIISSLMHVTGLVFAQNIIDVYIVNPSAMRSISHPLIIGGGLHPSVFPRVLTHELIHCLAADNDTGINWHFVIQKILKRKYRNESVLTINHVMIHAILEAVYTNLGVVDEIVRDKKVSTLFPDYARSWKIVEELGSDAIISQIKKQTA